MVERNERQNLAGNLFDQDVVVRYEMKNFKATPVTLDVAESLDQLRRELGLSTEIPVEWELGDATNFDAAPDPGEREAGRIVLSARLDAAHGTDQGVAAERMARLHIRFKNQW